MSRLPVRPFTLFLLATILVLLFSTFSLGQVSREAPLWIVVLTLALAVLQVLIEAAPAFSNRLPVLRSDSLFGASRHLDAWRRGQVRKGTSWDRGVRVARIALWVAGFTGLVYGIGFGAAVPIFLLPYLKTEGGLGWKGSILVTGIVGGLFYVVSAVLPGLNLPPGAFI